MLSKIKKYMQFEAMASEPIKPPVVIPVRRLGLATGYVVMVRRSSNA